MKIIFLVDSNKESGLGHLSRNIVFAKELKIGMVGTFLNWKRLFLITEDIYN